MKSGRRRNPSKARPISDADRAGLEEYLRGQQARRDRRRDPAVWPIRSSGNETNPVLAARKIYDWVLHNVDYWVKDPEHKKASPVGSTTYCLTFHTGNCTDFESLWTSLARAKGIPTQIVYGSFLKPSSRPGGGSELSLLGDVLRPRPGLGAPRRGRGRSLQGRHPHHDRERQAWFASPRRTGPSGPIPAKVNYYLRQPGRATGDWSNGRDLIISPKQDRGPVNALPKAYVEVDGKAHPETTGWVRKLTFRERT